MGKLNQVVAVVNGKKSQLQKDLTEFHHRLQKADLLTGISRTYEPGKEDGDRYPSESKGVQLRVGEALLSIAKSITDAYDVIATQEYANSLAKADVVVGGQVLLREVPVTYLMFLGKQITDLRTLIASLPTLDPGKEWSFNTNQDCYSTEPKQTGKTKKVPKAFVKCEATKEHPAQVEVFHEDILEGLWTTIDYSGAIPMTMKKELLDRVNALDEAVTKAREAANHIDVTEQHVGKALFDYLLQPLAKAS